MKVIQTETKKHEIKTFVALNTDDEARILVAILSKEEFLNPRTDEEVHEDAKQSFTSQDKEYLAITDELVDQLPDTLKEAVLKVKERFNDNLEREQQKNANKQKLAELAAGKATPTEEDVPFLEELAQLAQIAAERELAHSLGWGYARQIYKEFPVTEV